MAFVIHSDEAHKVYYGMESTFKTALALDAATYKTIEFEKGQFPDLGIVKTNLNQNRSSRLFSLADEYHDNWSGPVVYSFSTYASKDRLADFLYMIFQNRVSQGGATAYQKVYRFGTTQPDFTANAGAFCTMIWDSPESGQDIRLTSGILRKLVLDWDRTKPGEASLMKMSGEFLFTKYETSQTWAGTTAARSISTAYTSKSFTLATELDGTSINPANWATFQLTLENGAVGIIPDANGNPTTYFLNPAQGIKASYRLWYTGNYIKAVKSYHEGDQILATLTAGSTGVDGYVNIALTGTITRTPIDVQDSQLMIPIDIQCGNSTASATDACDITIADSISQT